MSNETAHGLYTEQGRRINEWRGRLKMDLATGEPILDPPVRLSRGERVFLWWQGQLVAKFEGDGSNMRIFGASA